MPLEQFKEVLDGLDGYTSMSEAAREPGHDEALARLLDILENKAGDPDHLHTYKVKEAMGTADFPVLFGDNVNRELIARYSIARPDMMRICRKKLIPDFRTVRPIRVRGGTGRYKEVPENGGYQSRSLDEDAQSYKLKVWGDTQDFSWRSYVNDDLGAFTDIPARFTDGAINTLEWFITQLFWAAAAPINDSFGNAADTESATLSVTNLEVAISTMLEYTHPVTGEPAPAVAKWLVVPPRLKFQASSVTQSAMKLWLADSDDVTPPAAYPTLNTVAKEGLQVIVNPWIPIVCTTAPNTTWGLFADAPDRPSAEIGFRKGHEHPEIFLKAADVVRAGGGAGSPFDGSFYGDKIFYKSRWCMNGVVLGTDPITNWGSKGA